MPSNRQIHNRRIKALERIDKALGTSITNMRGRDVDTKIMNQMEAIASELEKNLNTPTKQKPRQRGKQVTNQKPKE